MEQCWWGIQEDLSCKGNPLNCGPHNGRCSAKSAWLAMSAEEKRAALAHDPVYAPFELRPFGQEPEHVRPPHTLEARRNFIQEALGEKRTRLTLETLRAQAAKRRDNDRSRDFGRELSR